VTTVVVATSTPAAAATFEALPGRPSVQTVDGEVTIRGQSPDLVTEVIRAIAGMQIHVTGFRTERPSLEDVFLEVTGHAIRE